MALEWTVVRNWRDLIGQRINVFPVERALFVSCGNRASLWTTYGITRFTSQRPIVSPIGCPAHRLLSSLLVSPFGNTGIMSYVARRGLSTLIPPKVGKLGVPVQIRTSFLANLNEQQIASPKVCACCPRFLRR